MSEEPVLDCAGHPLPLERPVVMGVLNVTPDSFSDGGRHAGMESALAHARGMVASGAGIIDVGGESTRPGAGPVPLQEELDRVIPVLERLRRELDVVLSIDTSKPAVMQAALDAGAGMINDVNGLRAPGAMEVVASGTAAVCVMHMQGQPRSMQERPHYADVVAEVADFLVGQAQALVSGGVARERIVLDPGFGFGKALEHNLALFRSLPALAALGYPLLVGVSRKSMIGALLGGRPVTERLAGSVTAAVLAARAGARILRVHDVRETVDALMIQHALEPKQQGEV
ncbi:dihydropteroate synthase [Thioalkalivibrio sp.]|uniref:dihydropteroate synthase n=1 Tax=Thioalkalivibrio sp. TaxID=2093813 RepID=UPI003565A6F3